MNVDRLELVPAPLTREAFAPFGEVIETAGRDAVTINFGYAERYHALASVDCEAEQGKPIISLFRAKPWPLPIEIGLLERHPISSQAFVPLTGTRFFVVVAAGPGKPAPADIRAFVSDGRQGINYRRGTWHHPLLALSDGDFLVVDRAGPGPGHDQDYEEVSFQGAGVTLVYEDSSR